MVHVTNMSEEHEDITKDGGHPESSPRPHDELWGRLVISVLLLGLLAMLAFFALLGYRIYDGRHENGPSIADLPKSAAPAEPTQGAATTAENTPAPEASAPIDAKQTVASVLNGGGAKGSAGTLAESLKQAGYAKTVAGNASGDSAGVIVFYKDGQEAVAKAVLAEVAKKYPKASIAPADAKRPETGSSPITVIIGK